MKNTWKSIFILLAISYSFSAGSVMSAERQVDKVWNHPVFIAAENFPDIAEKQEHYTETKIRRIEIIFLLALPFVALAHFAITASVYGASTGDWSFKTFPGELAVFSGLSTLMVTSYVTWYDSHTVNKPFEQALSEKTYHLVYSKRF